MFFCVAACGGTVACGSASPDGTDVSSASQEIVSSSDDAGTAADGADLSTASPEISSFPPSCPGTTNHGSFNVSSNMGSNTWDSEAYYVPTEVRVCYDVDYQSSGGSYKLSLRAATGQYIWTTGSGQFAKIEACSPWHRWANGHVAFEVTEDGSFGKDVNGEFWECTR
jgi:hypothetical protein